METQQNTLQAAGRRQINHHRLLLYCVFGLFTLLGFLFPYMHDDWAWGTQIGLDRLATFFRNYNGRYVSNLLIMLVTRVRWLRALSYGLCFVSIFHFGGRMIRKDQKNTAPLLLVLGLVLCIPHTMFAQAIAWASGYVNYVASVGMLFPLLSKVHSVLFSPQDKKAGPGGIVGWALLCFAGQLFVEHISIYVVLLLLVANLVAWRRDKRIHALLAVLLVVAILGAGVMFLNGAYSEAVGSEQNYQKLPETGLKAYAKTALSTYFNTLYDLTLLDNLVLSFALSVLAIALLIRTKAPLRIAAAPLIGFMALYQIIRKWLPFAADATAVGRYWEGAFCLIYLVCVAYALWQAKDLRWKGVFWLLSALALAAPLLIASPIGPRNFFVVYVFLAFLCAQMLHYLLAHASVPALDKPLHTGLVALCVGCTLFYVSIFGYVAWADAQRVADVHRQVAQGQQEITVQRLPFEAYMHGSSPQNSTFTKRFKLFYDVPESASLFLIAP